MNNRRKTDTQDYSKYRPSRFIKEGGKWFFSTREGTIEGPFEYILEAQYRLDSYIKIMVSGFAPRNRNLAICPLDVPALAESTPLT